MKIILMRGIPGSGKSTYVEKITSGHDAIICSADDYFMYEGRYTFNPSKLSEAHASCLRRYTTVLTSLCLPAARQDCNECKECAPELLVVDNTNTTPLELAPYVTLAMAYDYKCEIVRVNCDPEIAHRRNIHGVPMFAIQRMAENLKAPIPPYWNVTLINV